MSHPEPEDASLFESLHRAQFIAAQESGKEYGRLLRTWMDTKGDGILRDWYLRKIDDAVTVSSTDPDWEQLAPLIPADRRDHELFALVAGMEVGPIALDELGQWRVPIRHAIDIAKSYQSAAPRNGATTETWALIIGALFIVAFVSHCS